MFESAKAGAEIISIELNISGNPSINCNRVSVLNNGVLEIWRVQGNCSRCGICCQNIYNRCEHLHEVTIDGVQQCECDIYTKRFWNCVVYPIDPYEPLYPNCTYSWIKEE